jgi:hypothetical protein
MALNNMKCVKANGQIESPGFSHHDLIYLAYSIKGENFAPKPVEHRDIRNMDLKSLRDDAIKMPWDLLKYSDDVNDALLSSSK